MNGIRYLEIFNQLKDRISRGQWSIGEKIAPEPELANKYNCSVGTLRKAVALLIEQGMLERKQGSGTFVLSPIEIKTKESKVSKILWGHSSLLSFQEEIDRILQENVKSRIERVSCSELSTHGKQVPEDWQNCSVLQLNTLELQIPTIERSFLPVPLEIANQAHKMFPAQVLNACSSRDGRLKLLPIVANPTFCYLNKKLLKANGIPMPRVDWTWDDLLELCRQLKQVSDVPLTYVSCPANMFDLLLGQAGGSYYTDENQVSLEWEPFSKMMNFVMTLRREKLCVNLYNLNITLNEYFNDNKIGAVIQSPLFCNINNMRKAGWKAVPMFRDQKKFTSLAIFGLGVPVAAKNADSIWSFLKEIAMGSNAVNLSRLSMIAPAIDQGVKSWDGNKIVPASVISDELENSFALPGRSNYFYWWQPLFSLWEKAVDEDEDLEKVWLQSKEILSHARGISQHYLTFF